MNLVGMDDFSILDSLINYCILLFDLVVFGRKMESELLIKLVPTTMF